MSRIRAVYLIVHSYSDLYVSNLVRFVHEMLRVRSSAHVTFISTDDIGEVDIEPQSLVYVIGDPFRSFPRPSSARLVFINLSLLTHSHSESPAGCDWIERKAIGFAQKVGSFDAVLDIYPDQALSIEANFSVPTYSFLAGGRLQDGGQERDIDVCQIGASTPRRRVLSSRLGRLGLALSPCDGAILEDIASRSKIVLNVRAWRSANIEVPRILGAFASGACLLTETLSKSTFPKGLYVEAEYCEIAAAALDLVGDKARTARLAAMAREWFKEVYMPGVREDWSRLVPTLEARLFDPG